MRIFGGYNSHKESLSDLGGRIFGGHHMIRGHHLAQRARYDRRVLMTPPHDVPCTKTVPHGVLPPRGAPGAAPSRSAPLRQRPQCNTRNKFLESMIASECGQLGFPEQSRSCAVASRARPWDAAPRHRRPAGHYRAKRLRHRLGPHRGRVHQQAQGRPPQPLPDPGAPAASRAHRPERTVGEVLALLTAPGPGQPADREAASPAPAEPRVRPEPGSPRAARST